MIFFSAARSQNENYKKDNEHDKQRCTVCANKIQQSWKMLLMLQLSDLIQIDNHEHFDGRFFPLQYQ